MSSAVADAEARPAPRRPRASASTVTGTRRLGATAAVQVTGSNLVCVRDHNQLLVLHPDGAHAMGVEVAPQGCRIALCALAGRTLAEQRYALCTTSGDSWLDELALTMQDLIDDAEVPITT